MKSVKTVQQIKTRSWFLAVSKPYRSDVEFDYCCVHASLALREDGYETISWLTVTLRQFLQDYDTSDRLVRLRPVTLEDVPAIVRVEKPKVLSFSTVVNSTETSAALEAAGVLSLVLAQMLSTAEDRERSSCC